MLDAYLEILLALDEGDITLTTIARATGRTERETLDAIAALERSGFVLNGATSGSAAAASFHITTSGKTLLRLGYDELFKRTLTERLGGDTDSAS